MLFMILTDTYRRVNDMILIEIDKFELSAYLQDRKSLTFEKIGDWIWIRILKKWANTTVFVLKIITVWFISTSIESLKIETSAPL